MQIKKAIEDEGIEQAHLMADSILCQVLQELGYKELVDIYIEMDKWYA